MSVNSQAYKSLVAQKKCKNQTKDSRHVEAYIDSPHISSQGIIPTTSSTPPKKKHCRFQHVTGVESIQNITDQKDVMPQHVALEEYSLIKPVAVIPNQTWILEGSNSDSGLYDVCDSQNSSEHLCVTPRSHHQELGYSVGYEFETPPESPVPRPSSASTCGLRHEGAFCSLGAPWLDNSNGQLDFQSRLFKNRSLSFEEGILSTPVTSGCQINNQASPQRKIPRCRSQPSFIHDRKYGIKRRRNERPTLNFQKMTKVSFLSLTQNVY